MHLLVSCYSLCAVSSPEEPAAHTGVHTAHTTATAYSLQPQPQPRTVPRLQGVVFRTAPPIPIGARWMRVATTFRWFCMAFAIHGLGVTLVQRLHTSVAPVDDEAQTLTSTDMSAPCCPCCVLSFNNNTTNNNTTNNSQSKQTHHTATTCCSGSSLAPRRLWACVSVCV